MSSKLGSTSIGSLYLGFTKIAEAYLGSTKVYSSVDPYNPLGLPPFTIRCKFSSGTTPAMGDSQTLVDATNNVWDITKNGTDWSSLFSFETEGSTDAFDTELAGQGGSHNNMMPYLALTYLIRFEPDVRVPRMLMFNGCMPCAPSGAYLQGRK